MKNHRKFLAGIRSIQGIVDNLEKEVEELEGASALKLVQTGAFRGVSLSKLAEVQYRVFDKALEEVISNLFEVFPDLIFVTFAVCTEVYNDENDPGLNTLVFGFIPESLREMSIRSIRNYKEDHLDDLTAREKLYFASLEINFPVIASVDFWQEEGETEEGSFPPEFMERVSEVRKIAEQWFIVYEGNGNEDTNERFRYWRDGHFSTCGADEEWY